ncbi:hypothetical protein CEE45_13065 [Candidatus Heimdallarchaeota archaeon B3_Heim]|nr:MAG: hypothetical protein CEE45_13065 [Candidatus Heimdallarchaeota archaeon B3_Heim]
MYSAISRLNVDTQSAVFIGDSPSDLEASLRAKIQFILIKDASSTFIYPEIPQNVKIVSKVKELLDYCK